MIDLFTYTEDEIIQGGIVTLDEEAIDLIIKHYLPEDIVCGTNSNSNNVPSENCVCIHTFVSFSDSFCTCGQN